MLRALIAAAAPLVLAAGAHALHACSGRADRGRRHARLAAARRCARRRVPGRASQPSRPRSSAGSRRPCPSAHVRWRYRLVANGIAVVVPAQALPLLARAPGRPRRLRVCDVPPEPRPQRAADRRCRSSGGRRSQNAGGGDEDRDHRRRASTRRHPFFAPTGYDDAAGFPKGQTRVHDGEGDRRAGVPAARVDLAVRGASVRPELSGHGTHVAGIAAGNAGTATQGGRALSGVAPRAYLGNYKALTDPDRCRTSGSTATRPRSWRRSRPRSPTGWT